MNGLISRRMAGIILSLAVALALSACSAVKLGYNTLPQLAVWWLDGYLDFTDEQDPRVRDAVATLHVWHRQHQLPRVAELLAGIEQITPGEISPEQACSVVKEVQSQMKALAAQAEPAAVALAATLTPHQLRYLARKFRSKNERFRKDWLALSPHEQLEKRYNDTLDRLQTVYGTLDEAQRRVLRERLATTVWDPNRMLAQWERRQQDMLQILTRASQPDLPAGEAAALLRGWVERLQRPADPAYAPYQDALLQEGCATFAAVHQSTTTEQRDKAARRLRAWQRDVRELIAQQP